jgi:predicted dehydrogenase
LKDIRIGVVGIGHLGKYHLEKYEKLPGCTIAAVSDLVSERALRAADKYSCAAFTDYHNMRGAVDAVSIAVPAKCHFEVAGDFLRWGVDVLLEKPIADSIEDADELIRIADENKAVFQVGFVERFNPAIIALGEFIKKPMFIESHRLHPFSIRGTDVDVVLDLMVHDLDIILKFVDSPLKSAEAVGVSVLSNEVDIANARLTFESGCVANITASRVSVKNMNKIRFFGPEGYHSVDYTKRDLVSISRKVLENGEVEIAANGVEIRMHDPLEEEIRSFLDAVRTRSVPLVSGREARKSLKIALEIVEIIRPGQEKIALLHKELS